MYALRLPDPPCDPAEPEAAPAEACRPSAYRMALFRAGPRPGELLPLEQGDAERAIALRLAGEAMRGLADEGALIFFEEARAPAADMLGHVVVVETATGEVLVRRLLKADGAGSFDLESQAAGLRRGVRLRWAAHITAIIPPHTARRILISGTSPRRPRCLCRSGQEESE